MSNPANSEVHLLVTSDEEDSFRFTVSSDRGQYVISYTLSPGWRAQLQRLHWKAGGLLPEDDSFLEEVSRALKDALFPTRERQIWQPLLSGEIDDLRIEFARGSAAATLLPFELISIDGCYLVDVPGLRVVRELGAKRSTNALGPSSSEALRILHVSLGTDPVLDLRRERARLLNRLRGVPLQFLVSPTLEQLTVEIERFKPSVVHVSSHGEFDTLNEQHGTTLAGGANLSTRLLLETAENAGARLVFLASCQSALVASEERRSGRRRGAIEITGFSFPVESETAQRMAATFYGKLADGVDTATAIVATRQSHLADVFSSFSLVHYRPTQSADLAFAPIVPSPSTTSTHSFVASEKALARLDAATRSHPRVQIVSPIGFGARTLLREWRELQQQSDVVEVETVSELALAYRLHRDEEHRQIEIVRFFEYRASSGTAVVVLGAVGDYSDGEGLDDPAHAQAIASVGILAASVPRISQAILKGESPNSAVQELWIENRLDERLQGAGPEARILAKELIGLGGVSRLPLNSTHGVLSLDGPALEDARRQLMKQRVAIELDNSFRLSPEIMYFADGLFPDWRERSRTQLELVAGAFAMVYKTKPLVTDDDFASVLGLLQWSANLEHWEVLHGLLLLSSSSFQTAARTSDLIPFTEKARDHLTGEDRLIHEGNLSAFASHRGRFQEGLEKQRQLERAFEQSPPSSDRTRNLLAAKTQRVDALINLGRPDEALAELPAILELLQGWADAPRSAEANVLGLFGEAHRAKKEYRTAAGYFVKALSSLKTRGATEEGAVFLYSLANALLADDDVNGASTVFSLLERELQERPRPELLSNFYHLKGRLLAESHHPDAVKYMLQSLELDLAADRTEDALVSLVTVMDYAELTDDRDAIRSMLPKLKELAANSQHPGHLRSVARIEKTVAGWNSGTQNGQRIK